MSAQTAVQETTAQKKSGRGRPKSTAREMSAPAKVEPDITRRFFVRKRQVTEFVWVLPEGIEDRKQARLLAEDEGEKNAHQIQVVAEHWIVVQESKSDVVRRLFNQGFSAAEISKLTGWDYGFVYGVSWRDSGGR